MGVGDNHSLPTVAYLYVVASNFGSLCRMPNVRGSVERFVKGPSPWPALSSLGCFSSRCSFREYEVTAAVAPDPQQQPFVARSLRQSRRFPSVPDLLAID